MADIISINEIKKELEKRPGTDIIRFCLRLCRFKKENKELMGFLLFEADDIQSFIREKRGEIRELFTDLNTSHVFYAKKTIRKILRIINKYNRITGSKHVEAELLIQFCLSLQSTFPSFGRNRQLKNLYEKQQQKIVSAIATLHPDLQYDLEKEFKIVEG